jgi:integrase
MIEKANNTAESRRARGDGRIFLRGKIWWAQFYDRGEQVRESTGETDEKKAGRFLRRRLGEVATGTRRDTRRITYESMRDSFLADYATNGRKSLRHDREGKPYLDKVARLDDFFAGYHASDIDADLIRKFISDQQGKGLANGTINRSISALRRMFNIARADGKLRDIPYFPLVKEARPRQGFFEREQFEGLFRALPEYLRLPVAIGYFTGMRLGEILPLEWSQVDFLRGVIQLRAGETKNDEAREVPIVPQLRTLLVEQRAKRQPDCPHVCFRIDRRGRAVKIEGFRKAWYSACVRSGLGRMEPKTDRDSGEQLYAAPRGPRSKPRAKMVYRGLIFHDLRRTGARNLVHAGVPEKVAMRIGGWKTRSVFDRYTIVSPNDITEAGRKLEIFHGLKVGDNSGTIGTIKTTGNPPVN